MSISLQSKHDLLQGALGLWAFEIPRYLVQAQELARAGYIVLEYETSPALSRASARFDLL